MKGVIGLGMPTISIALLSLGMGLPAAVQIIVVPTLITNIWQALAGDGLRRLVARFHALLLTTVLGVWLGYALLFRTNPKAMTAVLGTAIVAYSLSGLFERPLMPRVRRERVASPVVGLTTGVLAGATGNLSMPAIAYLQQLNLPRNDLVQMLGILFTVGTAALGTAIAGHDSYDQGLLLVSVLSVVPASIGMLAGQRARGRLSDRLFRRALFLGLLLLGAHLVASGVG